MPHPVQILGLCRFSVPSYGGFQSQEGDIDAIRARLYQPARLESRLAWFEHVTLPALRRQQDPDFTLVLLIGEDLPEPWRGRLLALVADVPQIVVETAATGPHREICAAAMRPHVRPEAKVLAQFRLDDDDAVSVSFTARVRSDLGPVSGLLNMRRQFAVDYGKGLVLSWSDEEGLSASPRYARQWTPGLVHVSRPELGRYILDMDHSRMWWYMPVLSWTDEFIWIRGDHGGNDSSVQTGGREAIGLSTEEVGKLLSGRFHVKVLDFARRLLEISAGPG